MENHNSTIPSNTIPSDPTSERQVLKEQLRRELLLELAEAERLKEASVAAARAAQEAAEARAAAAEAERRAIAQEVYANQVERSHRAIKRGIAAASVAAALVGVVAMLADTVKKY